MWGYHFNEELLKNIYLVYAYQWKKRRPFKHIHYKSDLYSGSSYPRLNIARFDIMPRFIFIHVRFKLMCLNSCSSFFFLFIMATGYLTAGGWKWVGGGIGVGRWVRKLDLIGKYQEVCDYLKVKAPIHPSPLVFFSLSLRFTIS